MRQEGRIVFNTLEAFVTNSGALPIRKSRRGDETERHVSPQIAVVTASVTPPGARNEVISIKLIQIFGVGNS
jgi:hypothetical protein